MIRRIAAVIFALTIHPALLHAQDTVVTITVESADVYKGPSNVTPVVGHAARGVVLPVTRNLGSWLKVPWPGTPDGVGYVHVTMGRLGAPGRVVPATKASPAAPQAPSATAPQTTIAPRPHTGTAEQTVVRSQQDGTTISHVLGLGGQLGSMSSFGATARAWRGNRLGFQLGVTRDVMTSDSAAGRVTSVQFEPAVVYALLDDVRDYVWIRPYVGSGLSFRHQTFKDPALPQASDTGLGVRVFGGTELTFASVTQFGLSVEVGYRPLPTAFPGFEAKPFVASIAGHWYIK
jgi:hypothetical protein